MAVTKPKKPDPEELAALQSDVASFASSLGFALPTHPSAGFDDSDFRKSGPIKPRTTPKVPSVSRTHDNKKKTTTSSGPEAAKPSPQPHPLQFDPLPPPHSKRKDFPKLPLMKPSLLSGHWYIDAEELEMRVLGGGEKRVAAVRGMEELKRLVEKKREVAERLLEQYTREYEATRRKSGDMRLLEVTARSGTSADKVSAFTCLVEDNPIANMRSLDALLSMVTSKVGKRYAFTGFEALKELFLLRLLPDRKLKCLLQRPLDSLPESKDGFSLLLFWHWEECLKQRYERFVVALEEALKDMLPNLKDKAMKTVFVLLRSKSEQERRLLTALVNKLGDPERKVASSAGYHLSCLLSAHPNMKAVVIDEVDSFIFRPHIGLRAKYQAVNFLSQILLSKKGDGPKIAKRLVDVYFALFKVLIAEGKTTNENGGSVRKNIARKKEKGEKDKKKPSSNSKEEPSLESNVEMDSRLLSALLTGVNRAFPFVTSDEADDIIEVQMPILFKLVHSENFNVGVQALMLLYQITSKNQIVSDRFYRALYSKLLTPAAVNSSKPEMFLGLLVKAMKNDVNLKRIAAFSKRLLQVALQRPPQYACGCLFLLSEVLKAKPPLWTMVLQNESVDDELEHFEDIKEKPENVSDKSPDGNPGDACGFPTSQNGEALPASHPEDPYHSEGEGFDEGVQSASVAGAGTEQVQSLHMGSSLPAGYNPRHREPSFCFADHTAWWELTILATHVHPSVATMAGTLLSGANIVYNGDPLNDLSLNAFLDKFMEKKPKANRKAEGQWHGGSQIAPARKLDMNHHLIGDEILQLAEEEVPPEDVVFHRFYMNKTSSSKKPKAKKKKAAVDDETAEELLADANDESEEEEIDNMLGSGQLRLDEGIREYDYDDLDRVADEDDDELLSDNSDVDTEPPTQSTNKKYGDSMSEDGDDGGADIWDDGGGDIDDGDSDDEGSNGGRGDEPAKTKSGKKRKFEGIARASPFASLEDYEHLMSDDRNTRKNSKSKSQMKNKKKKTSN